MTDMPPEQPLVSVLMGVYYKSPDISALERSVGSVLAQSHRNIELLVCDDGSSPEAARFIDGAAAKDGRLVPVRPGNAFTLPQKLNRCLEKARGPYIARMDDDDFSHPRRFEEQLGFLAANDDVDFVGCCVFRVSASGERELLKLPERPSPEDFLFSMPYIHPALLFRREAMEALKGYSEAKSRLLCEDYDLLLRAYALGMKGANLQQPLFDYSMAGVEQKRRGFKARLNEAAVRFSGFRALGMLPGALPYVVKPLAVALLPLPLVNRLRKIRDIRNGRTSP